MLSVPSDSSGEISLAAGVVRREKLLYGPVVGKGHRLPAGVVKLGILGVFHVREDESPAVVELCGVAERGLGLHTETGGQGQKSGGHYCNKSLHITCI